MTNSQSLKSAPKKFPYLVSIVALTLFRGTGHPTSLIQGYNPSMLAGYHLSRDLISPELGNISISALAQNYTKEI